MNTYTMERLAISFSDEDAMFNAAHRLDNALIMYHKGGQSSNAIFIFPEYLEHVKEALVGLRYGVTDITKCPRCYGFTRDEVETIIGDTMDETGSIAIEEADGCIAYNTQAVKESPVLRARLHVDVED